MYRLEKEKENMRLVDLESGQILTKEQYYELYKELVPDYSISMSAMEDSDEWREVLKKFKVDGRIVTDNILNGEFVICQIIESAIPHEGDDGEITWSNPQEPKATFFIKSDRCI